MIKVKIYKTKEVPELAFEVSDAFEPIEEQLIRVKKILIDRIDEDFKMLQIEIKEDLLLNLTPEEEIYKKFVIEKKTINL